MRTAFTCISTFASQWSVGCCTTKHWASSDYATRCPDGTSSTSCGNSKYNANRTACDCIECCCNTWSSIWAYRCAWSWWIWLSRWCLLRSHHGTDPYCRIFLRWSFRWRWTWSFTPSRSTGDSATNESASASFHSVRIVRNCVWTCSKRRNNNACWAYSIWIDCVWSSCRSAIVWFRWRNCIAKCCNWCAKSWWIFTRKFWCSCTVR